MKGCRSTTGATLFPAVFLLLDPAEQLKQPFRQRLLYDAVAVGPEPAADRPADVEASPFLFAQSEMMHRN